MSNNIDFVIMWVDGSDPKWINSYNENINNANSTSYTNPEMYRDYGILKYWFRGVEKFAPWVNKIHFVTCGHTPEWLNLNNPKLNIVRHDDFLDKTSLPVFNSRSIEINLHRIKGLSENFVYFNDDMFVIDRIKPNFFFKNGKPNDAMVMKYISNNKGIDHTILNDIGLINSTYSKKSILKNHLFNFINCKYSIKDIIKNMIFMTGKSFPSFINYHMPQPFTKSAFTAVWNIFEPILTKTSTHKFRDLTDINQYLIRFWTLVSNNFTPTNMNKDRLYLGLSEDNERIYNAIQHQSHKIICINDEEISVFEEVKNKLNDSFNQILPLKSNFEL